mmetsp:Transcript_709/g.1076  ORF Transcript_709/g.1076 Transcript_709/m.1076 type:complete len:221 (-) Transcript_709:955-1617(-)
MRWDGVGPVFLCRMLFVVDALVDVFVVSTRMILFVFGIVGERHVDVGVGGVGERLHDTQSRLQSLHFLFIVLLGAAFAAMMVTTMMFVMMMVRRLVDRVVRLLVMFLVGVRFVMIGVMTMMMSMRIILIKRVVFNIVGICFSLDCLISVVVVANVVTVFFAYFGWRQIGTSPFTRLVCIIVIIATLTTLQRHSFVDQRIGRLKHEFRWRIRTIRCTKMPL